MMMFIFWFFQKKWWPSTFWLFVIFKLLLELKELKHTKHPQHVLHWLCLVVSQSPPPKVSSACCLVVGLSGILPTFAVECGEPQKSTAALPTGISPCLSGGSAGDLEITSLRHVTSQESRADMFSKVKCWDDTKRLVQPLNRCNLQTWIKSLLILVKSFSSPQKTVWDDDDDDHHHHHQHLDVLDVLDVLVLFLSLVLHHHCQPENFPHQNVAMKLHFTKSPSPRQVFAALSYDAGDFDRKLGQWWWRALRHDRKANG